MGGGGEKGGGGETTLYDQIKNYMSEKHSSQSMHFFFSLTQKIDVILVDIVLMHDVMILVFFYQLQE